MNACVYTPNIPINGLKNLNTWDRIHPSTFSASFGSILLPCGGRKRPECGTINVRDFTGIIIRLFATHKGTKSDAHTDEHPYIVCAL